MINHEVNKDYGQRHVWKMCVHTQVTQSYTLACVFVWMCLCVLTTCVMFACDTGRTSTLQNMQFEMRFRICHFKFVVWHCQIFCVILDYLVIWIKHFWQQQHNCILCEGKLERERVSKASSRSKSRPSNIHLFHFFRNCHPDKKVALTELRLAIKWQCHPMAFFV